MGKLKELEFADLMIDFNGDGYFRHLKGYSTPIVKVSDEYYEDVNKLRLALIERESEREFFILHDEQPYRVAVVNTISDKGFFLRRPKYPIPSLKDINIPDAILNLLQSLGKQSGMILVSGATGSGKSTTIYSLLDYYISNYGDIIVAVEDPPEIPVNKCHSSKGLWYQIDAQSVGGYEKAMISAMRYNPRYIFLGEIRSVEVAKQAIRAAVNGHLVVTTIHGNSLQGAIYALQQIASGGSGGDLMRSILADGLLCVVNQQLLPSKINLGKRELKMELLHVGNDTAIRSKIRSGKLELLNTEIEMQQIKIKNNLSLI